MTELGEGAELANKYRVGRLLGEGGMATVFEGEHMRLGQKVAIKVLHENLMGDVELIARFEREGRALSKLKSRHVVRVFDVDEAPTGQPFLVMERLEGSDLDQELAARGPLPIAEAVGYVMQACSAMAEAHAVGVVHRDLKPSNLFLTSEGGTRIVKVLDFGIATDVLPEHGKRLTRTEAVMGTPVYMAPEQFRRMRDVDGRTDIWALGATLYEMLTGIPPFSGTAATIGVAVVNEDYPPVEAARPDVPAGLRAVIARTLEKEPANRFATMGELADALAPFGGGVVIVPASSPRLVVNESLGRASTRPALMPVLPAKSTLEIVEASTAAPAATAVRALSPRSSLRWLGLGVAGVVVATAVALAARGSLVGRTSPEPSSSAASPESGVSSGAALTSAAPSSSSVVTLLPLTTASPSVVRSAVPVASEGPPSSSVPAAAARTSGAVRPSPSGPSGPSAKPVAKPPNSGAPPLFFPGQ